MENIFKNVKALVELMETIPAEELQITAEVAAKILQYRDGSQVRGPQEAGITRGRKHFAGGWRECRKDRWLSVPITLRAYDILPRKFQSRKRKASPSEDFDRKDCR